MPSIIFPPAEIENAVRSGVTTYTRRVDVYESDNTTIFAGGVGVSEGSITIDLGATERRSADLTLVNTDGRLDINRTSGFWYDKIIRVVMGVVGLSNWETPIGTFLIDRIGSSNQSDEINLTLRDFSKKLEVEIPFAVAWPINTQIELIVENLASGGGVPPSQTNLGVTTEFISKDLSFSAGADRWASMREVASAHGYDLFFDQSGILQMEPFTDPATSLPQFTFQVGEFSNIAAIRREIADKFIRNHQIVTGEDLDGDPVWGEVFNTASTSPTNITRLGFRTETYKSAWITSSQQAIDLANHRLAYSSLESYEANLDTILIPWLDVNVTAEFQDPASTLGVAPTPYTYPGGGSTVTAPVGQLQATIDAAAAGDTIEFTGDHTAEGEITISKGIYLKGSGVDTAKTDKILIEAPVFDTFVDGVWLTDFTVERLGPPTAHNIPGIGTGQGALTNFRFSNLKVTGHGFNVGIELLRRWRNDRGVISNVEVWEIENIGFLLHCDNLRTWGLIAHDLYRTDDISFADIDAVNYAGSNQIHSGFHFYGIHELDSLSDISSGRANPTGPLGTNSSPHPDGFQTYLINLSYPTRPWDTRNVLFEDGVIDYRTTAGVGGSGGRSGFGWSMGNSGTTYSTGDHTVRRVKVVAMGTTPMHVNGIDELLVDDCDFWLINPNTSGSGGLDQTFSAFFFGVQSGGPVTNLNPTLNNNRVWRAHTGQFLYTGNPEVVNLVETGNVINEGDPPLAGWDSSVVQTPADYQIEAWLNDTPEVPPVPTSADPTRFLLSRAVVNLDLSPAEVRLARVAEISVAASNLFPRTDLFPAPDLYPSQSDQ